MFGLSRPYICCAGERKRQGLPSKTRQARKERRDLGKGPRTAMINKNWQSMLIGAPRAESFLIASFFDYERIFE